MKKIKYIIIFILSIGLFNSCLIDNETELDQNDAGPNLVGFEKKSQSWGGIADGNEYDFDVYVKLFGPTSMDVTEDINVVITVDEENSTAEAGVHYRIDESTMTLTAQDNHLGILDLTVLSSGMSPPLQKKLVLEVSEATGNSNVLPSGKKITVNLSYGCPSYLAGTYELTVTSSSGGSYTAIEEIKETGVGEYLTASVGTWNPPLNPGYGFVFTDLCGDLTVPLQGLADMYSNDVWGHMTGEADPDTGVLTIYYTIAFGSGDVTYTAVYTPL